MKLKNNIKDSHDDIFGLKNISKGFFLRSKEIYIGLILTDWGQHFELCFIGMKLFTEKVRLLQRKWGFKQIMETSFNLLTYMHLKKLNLN